MTHKDWQLWHKLKWNAKAIENLTILNEMYPLNEREKADFEKLMKSRS